MSEKRTWGDVHVRWRVHRMQGKLTCGTEAEKPWRSMGNRAQ